MKDKRKRTGGRRRGRVDIQIVRVLRKRSIGQDQSLGNLGDTGERTTRDNSIKTDKTFFKSDTFSNHLVLTIVE